LWATQVDSSTPGKPLRDRVYLFAGLAELCGAFGACDLIIEHAPLAWPWWGLALQLAETGWEFSIIFFCVELAGLGLRREVRRLRRGLLLMLMVSLFSSALATIFSLTKLLTILDTFSDLALLSLSIVFLWNSLRRSQKQLTIVAMAILLTVLVDVHHTYVVRFSPWYADQSYHPYSSLLFGLALGFVVMQRFHWTSEKLRELVANMAEIVARKEQEIEQSYKRTEQLVRQGERTMERTRVLRDLHDGVGSHICTAIHQIQSGKASDGEVLQTLRGSLEQLKLTIDAMNLPAGDITSLLANLRYRLEPRLKRSDIELQWNVDVVVPLIRLDERAMLELQYMVFEAISNVLQHARASLLRIELRGTPQGGATLRVIDNGRGFESESKKDKGLRSLRERAAAIGAHLEVMSHPGNTVVEIQLA
jgi:signal transduction histidine kinase